MAPIRHARLFLALCAVAVLLASVCFPALAHAVIPGYNGWYWPTGHSATSTGGGWLQHRVYASGGEAWHLAWDDCGPVHEPVYAATWGVVDFASMKVGGYGWDPVKKTTAPGGAIVVKYRSADGGYFKVLYGHLDFSEAKLPVGSKVRPGQRIAVTTAYSNVPHVHLGIHLGEGDPAAPATPHQYVGMLMGHTHEYTSRVTTAGTVKTPVTYGFVDPVSYLRSHKPFTPAPAIVGTPTAPHRVATRRLFYASGTFVPKTPDGSSTVTLECDHWENGAWVRRASFPGVNHDAGADASRYEVGARLPLRGAWRVRAYAADDMDWSKAASGWTYVTAR